MAPVGFEDKIAFVWRVADKLRGTFKQHEYGSVMLPLLVLRRMDAVLAPTRDEVRAKAATFTEVNDGADAVLRKVAQHRFYNTSRFTFSTLLSDDKYVAANLRNYINRLSPDARRVIEAYELEPRIERMDRAGILYAVLADFADLDLRPSVVSNEAMGYIFEELLRKFSEMSNETAGEHYTPREVIRLMVDLLVSGRTAVELQENPVPVRTVYDPAAGTGGMLMTAMARIKELNDRAIVNVAGQELNDETWAIAQSDLMMQDIDPARMRNGNTLTQDAFATEKFDYILANPPYGVDWKAYAAPIKDENARLGHAGRFGAGLPRVSDGSFLFLQHMLSHMKPNGSRVGIVLSGSPLFSGQAGSGESEIRRWILENDWLEGIVALPDQMFYNTGISTYVWTLTNDKAPEDAGLVRLVDARDLGSKMRKSLGDKRKELTPAAIDDIVRLYLGALDESAGDTRVKVLPREAFGFQRITVERPLRRRWEVTPDAVAAKSFAAHAGLVGQRFETEKALLAAAPGLTTAQKKTFAKACAVADPEAPIVTGRGGKAEPDPDLRDAENVPLPAGWFDLDDDARVKALEADAEQHLATEIQPYVPDAWIDHAKTKLGVEIPFTRQFYVYEPPRPVEEIAAEIKAPRDSDSGVDEGSRPVTVLDQLGHRRVIRRLGTITHRVQDTGHAEAVPLSVFLDGGVVPRSHRSDNHNALGSDLAKYQLVRSGDLVFNRLRTWQGGFGSSRYEGIVSPAYIVARPSDADARYLDYVLHSAPYLAELVRISKWMPPSQFDVLWSDLRQVPVPWVPPEEQRRIADFLDDRVARIDQIIAVRHAQEVSIDESFVAQRRGAVVGPSQPTSPTGLAWADHASTDRPVRRLSQVARIGTGHTPSRSEPSYWAECHIPWLTTTDVHRFRRDEIDRVSDTAVHISSLGLANSAAVLHPAGTVALSRTASAGFSIVMDQAMATSQDFVTWTCGPDLRPDFLLHTLRVMRPFLLGNLATGSTHKTIYFPDLMDLRVLLPSVEAQEEAVRHVQESTARRNVALIALRRQVELLKEYKQSLITAAVAGELDVTTAGSRIPG